MKIMAKEKTFCSTRLIENTWKRAHGLKNTQFIIKLIINIKIDHRFLFFIIH